MSKYVIDDSTLTGIADAIRAKDETTDPIPVDEMAARIGAIDTAEDLSPEITTQDDLITQLQTAIQGKVGASGDDVLKYVEGSVTLASGGGQKVSYPNIMFAIVYRSIDTTSTVGLIKGTIEEAEIGTYGFVEMFTSEYIEIGNYPGSTSTFVYKIFYKG